MKKYKRNGYSIDYLSYRKRYNFYLTIVLLLLTLIFLIAGFIFLSKNQNGYMLGCFIVSGIYAFATLYVLSAYLKFKRLINKILDSLSDEEKNDVAFLMSIDYRDYLKKNYKDTDKNEDFDD